MTTKNHWKLSEAILAFFPDHEDYGGDTDNALLNISSIYSNAHQNNKKHQQILDYIKAGEFWLCAYKTPVVTNDRPIRLSPEHLNFAQLDWDNNKFTINGREYIHAYLMKAHKEQPKPEAQAKTDSTINPTQLVNPQKTQKKTVGRPSHKQTIFAIYTKLDDAGYIDYTATIKSILNQVRTEVYKSDPKTFAYCPSTQKYQHLSDTVMKEALSKVIKSKKAKIKS